MSQRMLSEAMQVFEIQPVPEQLQVLCPTDIDTHPFSASSRVTLCYRSNMRTFCVRLKMFRRQRNSI